jgi:putative hydrolase
MLSMKKDYHIHCNYNDHSSPDLTIPNVVKYGENIGLIEIDFTEHVRKISDWIPQYLKEIEHIRSDRVKIIAGFEAKILIDGSIDCPEKYADKYFLIAGFHTKYDNKRV